MKRAACVVLAAGMLLAAPAHADDSEFQPRLDAIASDYEAGKKAVLARDWHRAIQVLERAAKGDPKDADVQNLLGYSYRKLGHVERAIRHYARALELNPKHLGAHEYVGELWLSVGNPSKAREHLDILRTLCPAVCEEREDLEKAIAEHQSRLGPPPTR